MAARAKYIEQLNAEIAELRERRRVEITVHTDALREQLVQQMRDEVDVLREQYLAFIEAAEARP